ncbi:helix-turn-helix domain-containing protein, partial [Actinospica durhamensis]
MEPTFATELRRLRHAAGLTIEGLAARSGLTDRAISELERGRSRGPQHRTVAALSRALDLDGAGRERLSALARAGRPRPPAEAATPCALPRAVTHFTGRTSELAALSALTSAGAHGTDPDRPSTVLLSGQGGIGKTALAVHAARMMRERFPDGQMYLDLRGLDSQPLEPGAVLTRLLRALGVREREIAQDLDERGAQYRALLRERALLLLLDNAADEAQVRPLLPDTGAGTVLLTSRRLLTGLEGVSRLPLAPLQASDSAALLASILADRDAAGAESGPYRPQPEEALEAVADLCGHLPLALRIAGNRLLTRPAWSTGDLVARLADEKRRLEHLRAGDVRITAAFALSYEQLTDSARALCRRLSLVPGPDFSLELAAVLADDSLDAAEDALDELYELSLLEQRTAERYAFHDLIRLFAGRRLGEEESQAERDLCFDRMTGWLLEVAAVAGRWFLFDGGGPAAGCEG